MLLHVENISKSFMVDAGLFKKERQQVLHNISFTMQEGECLGIVGESGSGKSTLGKLILGLEKPDSGCICFSPEVEASPLQRSVVFQDYTTSINPRMHMWEAIAEPLTRLQLSKAQCKEHVEELLTEVGLSHTLMYRHAHQLSGGQLQRVCIARALAPKPAFILFDEAVSSLDVSVQAQILMLMRKLKEKSTMAFLFITHDITVAAYVCDKLIFLNKGYIAEYIEDMKNLPLAKNEYARKLLQAAQALEQPFIRKMCHEN